MNYELCKHVFASMAGGGGLNITSMCLREKTTCTGIGVMLTWQQQCTCVGTYEL